MDLISRNSDDGYINLADPRIIAVENSQKDNLNLGDAMKADDRDYFMKATGKEIKDLNTEDVWEIFPNSSPPTSAHIIQLIWRFKIFINPFEYIIKHKDRLCVHSGMKLEGVGFNNTFSPVVNWSIVMLIIMMDEMAGW